MSEPGIANEAYCEHPEGDHRHGGIGTPYVHDFCRGCMPLLATAWHDYRAADPPAGRTMGAEEKPSEPERCAVCSWPLMPDGCRPGDCSYRPNPGSAEWHRIRNRREQLGAKAAPLDLSPAEVADEIERRFGKADVYLILHEAVAHLRRLDDMESGRDGRLHAVIVLQQECDALAAKVAESEPFRATLMEVRAILLPLDGLGVPMETRHLLNNTIAVASRMMQQIAELTATVETLTRERDRAVETLDALEERAHRIGWNAGLIEHAVAGQNAWKQKIADLIAKLETYEMARRLADEANRELEARSEAQRIMDREAITELRKRLAEAERIRPIDPRFHVSGSRIIKTSSGEVIPEDEPLILQRGRDRLMLPTLRHFRSLAVLDACNDYLLGSIDERIAAFEAYASDPSRMKQPGITRGAAWNPDGDERSFGPCTSLEPCRQRANGEPCIHQVRL